MAQVLTQFHRGNRPPQFLFAQPHYTGRKTVSGAEIVERDWFVEEAAGVKEPAHPGETMGQYRERKAKRRRAFKYAALTLLAVALLVAMRVW